MFIAFDRPEQDAAVALGADLAARRAGLAAALLTSRSRLLAVALPDGGRALVLLAAPKSFVFSTGKGEVRRPVAEIAVEGGATAFVPIWSPAPAWYLARIAEAEGLSARDAVEAALKSANATFSDSFERLDVIETLAARVEREAARGASDDTWLTGTLTFLDYDPDLEAWEVRIESRLAPSSSAHESRLSKSFQYELPAGRTMLGMDVERARAARRSLAGETFLFASPVSLDLRRDQGGAVFAAKPGQVWLLKQANYGSVGPPGAFVPEAALFSAAFSFPDDPRFADPEPPAPPEPKAPLPAAEPWDIRGVTLALPLDEAIATIDALAGPFSAALSRTREGWLYARGGSNIFQPYGLAEFRVAANGRESYMFYSEPPEGAESLTAITRVLDFDTDKRPAPAGVIDALKGKYGEPELQKDEVMIWINETVAIDGATPWDGPDRCEFMMLVHADSARIRYARDRKDLSLGHTYDAEAGALFGPSGAPEAPPERVAPLRLDEMLGAGAACPHEVLIATLIRDERSLTETLITTLARPAEAAAMAEANRNAALGEAAETAKGAPPLDL